MEPHARCVENEALALYILEKREAFVAKEGYKEKLDATLTKAYRNVCDCKHPICSLRDASQVHGIGQWMLKLLKGFFPDPPDVSQEAICKASGDKARRRYVPQKSSAPYAILLTLYKAMQEGRECMKKQELIDAAEASGLSRMSIQPSNCSGPSGQFGYSTKDWYSGWSSMKTLVTKGLVVKSSCPAKYKLTEEGISTAEDCIQRSGIQTNTAKPSFSEGIRKCSASMPSALVEDSSKTAHLTSTKHNTNPVKVPALEGVNEAKARVSSVSDSYRSFHIEEFADVSSDSGEAGEVDSFTCYEKHPLKREDYTGAPSTNAGDSGVNSGWLHLPPLIQGERFLDTYAVILILDNREQFMNDGKGNSCEKFAVQLRSQFQIEVKIRHLPIGDTLWVARHKLNGEEYVLDFIVERKKVSDLLHSIRDTRYKQQKLRLLRCGLRKLIYVVEGDPNVMDSSESIKTACFTTEIAEGFDVQRTRDVKDTMRKYGHLTHAIGFHYNDLSDCQKARQGLCKTYRQFVDDCRDLEKEKVSDIFGVMLMQVKQVTESIALSILERYPTPLSLVLAYSRLRGDERAQEHLLKGMPIINQNKEISGAVSKRVFHFFCSADIK